MDEFRKTVESVFRQESGRILATLIRLAGSFDLAEEAMQEAFATAVSNWPAKGLPDNPGAWITSVAHRKLVTMAAVSGLAGKSKSHCCMRHALLTNRT